LREAIAHRYANTKNSGSTEPLQLSRSGALRDHASTSEEPRAALSSVRADGSCVQRKPTQQLCREREFASLILSRVACAGEALPGGFLPL
jgi:hypothetical protein